MGCYADRKMRGVTQRLDERVSGTQHSKELTLRCPAPRPDRHSLPGTQADRAQAMTSSQVEAQETVQEEGSGYMDTESDSDVDKSDKSQVHVQAA